MRSLTDIYLNTTNRSALFNQKENESPEYQRSNKVLKSQMKLYNIPDKNKPIIISLNTA